MICTFSKIFRHDGSREQGSNQGSSYRRLAALTPELWCLKPGLCNVFHKGAGERNHGNRLGFSTSFRLQQLGERRNVWLHKRFKQCSSNCSHFPEREAEGPRSRSYI